MSPMLGWVCLSALMLWLQTQQGQNRLSHSFAVYRGQGCCQALNAIIVKRKSVQDLLDKFWKGDYCDFRMCSKDNQFHFQATIEKKDETSQGGQVYYESELPPNTGDSCAFTVYTCELLDRHMLARLLHQFLRQYGHIIHSDFLFPALEAVHQIWQSSRKYEEAVLDCTILAADLVLLVPPSKLGRVKHPSVSTLFHNVSAALCNLGRDDDFILLNVEILQNFTMDQDDEFSILVNNGRAHSRMQRMDESLMCFINVLKLVGKKNQWNLNARETRSALSHLLCQHALMFQHGRMTREGEQLLLSTNESLFFVLSCLLVAAGCDLSPGQECLFGEDNRIGDCMKRSQQKCRGLMKPIYLRPKNARSTLLKAFHATTVKDYKDLLMVSVKENVVAKNSDAKEILPKDNWSGPDDKKILTKFMATRSSCYGCGMFESEHKAFQMCPCQNAFYCSPVCRKNDWKEHKEVCPLGDKIKQCSHCDARELPGEKLWKCECGNVYYCSEECRLDHWNEHKQTCSIYLAKTAPSAKKPSKKRGKKKGKKKN